MIDCKLLNNGLGQRDLNIAFYTSAMTNVPELESDRHAKLNQVEFTEFMGRISEVTKLNSTSIFHEVQALDGEGDPVIEGDLAHKIQNFIKRMMGSQGLIPDRLKQDFIRRKLRLDF